MTEKERMIKETMNQYLMYGCKKITLSMVLPPYCYTPGCPDPTRRESGLIWKGKHNDYGIGYRY